MKKEIRMVCYDDDLGLEAYHFKGIVQPFPNHFHDYYVIGFVEDGKRYLSCKNTECIISSGDILLFNPNDSHGCIQKDEEPFDYRGINISSSRILSVIKEITGKEDKLIFSHNIIRDTELQIYLKSLHQMIMIQGDKFEKEEMFFIFMSMLIERYTYSYQEDILEYQNKIEKTCLYMENNYASHITLEQLCEYSHLTKSTLLRAFTKSKGVTPYRYLQSIRITKAKVLLEKGLTPIEVALKTGFVDQSHFTNYFHMYIGLSPAIYRKIFKGMNHRDEV